MGATPSTRLDPRTAYIQDIQRKYEQHGKSHAGLAAFLAEKKKYLSIRENYDSDSVEDAKTELSCCQRYQKELLHHQTVTVVDLQKLGQEVITAEYGTGAEKWIFEEQKGVQNRERIVKELKECDVRFVKKLRVLEDRLKKATEKEQHRQYELEYIAISGDLDTFKDRITKVGSGTTKEREMKMATELQTQLKALEERIEKWKCSGASLADKDNDKSKDQNADPDQTASDQGTHQSTDELDQDKDKGSWRSTVQARESALSNSLKSCFAALDTKTEEVSRWKASPVRIINLPYKYRLSQAVQTWDTKHDRDHVYVNPRIQLTDPTPRPARDEFQVIQPVEMDGQGRKKLQKLLSSYSVTEKSEIRNQRYKDFIVATQGTVPTPSDRAYTEKEVKRAEASDTPCDIVMVGLARVFAAEGVDFVLTPDQKTSNLRNLMMIGGEQTNTTKVISVFTEGLFKMSFDDFRNDIFAQKKVELEVRVLAAEVFEVPVSEIAVLSFARGSDAMRFGCPGGKMTPERMDDFARLFVQKFQLSELHIETMDVQQTLALCKQDFDPRGDFSFPAGGSTQKRGGCDYFQPAAPWKRVGLRVLDRYENNHWLRMDGGDGEWAVGFHGSRSPEGIQGIHQSRIFHTNGATQGYADDIDINPQSDKKSESCGRGAYFARQIETSGDDYTAPVALGNGKSYRLVFQCRLHPKKMRQPRGEPDFLIVNEAQYVRPYGICYKEETSK